MLTPEQSAAFIGLQSVDGYLLALWNDATGSTRAVALGPVPAWATAN